MGKLTNLKSPIGRLSPRLGFTEGDQKAADKSRNQLAPWRKWYGTERWADLKKQVHVRDAYKCQRTGILCLGKYPAPNSPVANHRRPHKGDPALFWDPDNIETVSKAVHDSLIQSEERAAEFK